MIQVELNSGLVEVTKHRLFELAKNGHIGPETRIVLNGQESTAGKAKGIVFGRSIDDQIIESPSIPVPPPVNMNAVKYDALEWENVQQWEQREDKDNTNEKKKMIRERKLNLRLENTDTTIPMKSVFPHLAGLGPMLMWYNFYFFLISSVSVCGTLFSWYGRESFAPMAFSLLLLFGCYLFWRTVYGAILNAAVLAYSLYQNSIAQTELLKEMLENED